MTALPVTMPSAVRQLDFSAFGLPTTALDISTYNTSALAVLPLLSSLRYANTAVDALFYDVQRLWLSLYTRGVTVSTDMVRPSATASDGLAALSAAARIVNLSAMASPEGAILVLDAHRPPFITRYDDVKTFLAEGLAFPTPDDAKARAIAPKSVFAVAVSGVGSSALGSAAFAWNVSEALNAPVAAIVPGYGVADVVQQGLGGWYGFGMHDFFLRLTQNALAVAAPELAKVGRRLSRTSPGAETRALAKEAFRAGSPESDVLHDILLNAPQIRRLYGHSKGALCLQNAVRSLPPERYADLHVTTFGCVIEEETAADYNQIVGRFDSLGQMNSWGNWPERWIDSWHSMNTMLPLTMHAGDLVTQDVRAEDPVKVDPDQLRDALAAALKQILPPNLAVEIKSTTH